jgi:hypothetical protein
MNNYEAFKATLSTKNQKILDSDGFTIFAMDTLIFNDSEATIEEIKQELKAYKNMLRKEKIISGLIKINIPVILHFSYNFQINNTITMYLFNHRVMYFTRYGKIVHKKKMTLEEFFGCKGGLSK